jgi:hypothetical protein
MKTEQDCLQEGKGFQQEWTPLEKGLRRRFEFIFEEIPKYHHLLLNITGGCPVCPPHGTSLYSMPPSRSPAVTGNSTSQHQDRSITVHPGFLSLEVVGWSLKKNHNKTNMWCTYSFYVQFVRHKLLTVTFRFKSQLCYRISICLSNFSFYTPP